MEIEKIFQIIKDLQTVPSWVIKAREYSKELNALVNGVDFAELLIRIEHKENPDKQKARRKYARSIKDVFERLSRPIDNVYSATGGVKKYPDNAIEVIKKISTIRDGKTLEKWLQNNWMSLYHTDPNGVIMYEWVDDNFYPTYKSINSFRNYEADGQKLKWILFEPENKTNQTFWRFIDEEKDWLIQQDHSIFTVIEDKTFENPFEQVPGIVISDIIKIGTPERLSPFHSIIELAKEYLRDQSIKTIFKFLHGMPIFWRYAVQCQKCNGTGKTGDNACSDCFEGFYIKKDITDCVTLPVPADKEVPAIAPNIAGFIAPDLTTWDQYSKELELLYNVMFETIWGVQPATEVRKTATEVYQDLQPEITKLNVYADVAQWVEGVFTKLGLKFMLPTEKEQAVILYGRRFILESVQTLLEKYEKSKLQGDNSAILDGQLQEYMLSKYKNDSITMNEELLRLKVEPFIHFTIEQVRQNYGSTEAKEKMLFTSWWANKADKTKDAAVLIEAFKVYCDAEIEVVEPPVISEPIIPEISIK